MFVYSFSDAYAQSNGNRKAVIIVTPYKTLDDYKNNLRDYLDNNAVGIMNVRGVRYNNFYSSLLSINTGSRSNAKDTASEVIEYNSKYYIKNFKDIIYLNKSNHFNPRIGLLGDLLKKHNINYSILYFSSYFNYKNSVPSSLLMTDGNGIINNLNNLYPTEYDENKEIEEIITKSISNNDLVVIDVCNDYNDINTLVEIAHKNINHNDLLVLFSPYYSELSSVKGNKLMPIVLISPDISSSIITSDTTRRKGVVGNIDITPTLLKHFNISEGNYIGEEIKLIEYKNNIHFITRVNNRISFNTKYRFNILKSYIVFQIILLFSIYFLTHLKKKNIKQKLSHYLRYITLFTLSCPLIFLIMVIFTIYNLFLYYLISILINIVVVLLIMSIVKKEVNRVILISIITFLTIVIDIITGGYMARYSILSYDPVIGARYYGLGNEYMGILISSSLVGILPVMKCCKAMKYIGIIILISIIPVIGLSCFGANVGGTITASVAFTYGIITILSSDSNKKNKSIIITAIAIVILFMISFSIYDIFYSSQKSHLAKALFGIKKEGLGYVKDIIFRKISMNIKLLTWTIWSQVLVVTITILTILIFKPKGLLKYMLNKYKRLSYAWKASLLAGIIGMMVNDSGVVVAATCNIFFAFSIMYLLLGELKNGI